MQRGLSANRKLQSNLNGSNIFGKFIQDMGSSSHCGLIMALGQEANGDSFGVFLIFYTIMVCCVYSLESILMSTRNIQFHDKIRKFP